MPPQSPEQGSPDEGQALRCVLVVDTERPVRSLVRRRLIGKGYDVIEAESGEQGILLFQASRPSVGLIITNLDMPKLSGPEMVRRLRQTNHSFRTIYTCAGLPVEGHDRLDGPLFGKPFDFDALLRAVAGIFPPAG